MKTLLISFIFSIGAVVSLFAQPAQPHPILGQTTYNIGLYTDFYEFRADNPSIPADISYVANRPIGRTYKKFGKRYALFEGSFISRKALRKSWGFSDGNEIYINTRQFSSEFSFVKIEQIGRWVIAYVPGYIANEGTVTAMGAMFGIAGSLITIALTDDLVPLVMDFNSGDFYFVNKKILETILSKDKDLLDDYLQQSEPRFAGTIVNYLKKYNERHHDEIRGPEIKLTIYRSGRREREEEASLTVNGVAKANLPKYGFDTFSIEPEKEVQVCVGTSCLMLPASEDGTHFFIECNLPTNGKRPELKLKEEKKALFLLERLEKYNEISSR